MRRKGEKGSPRQQRQRQERDTTMKYQVEYKGKIRRYHGASAMQAMEAFERQNHIQVTVKMVDAATRGRNVAAGYVLGDAPMVYGEWVEMVKVAEEKEVA